VRRRLAARLGYCVFLNNVAALLPTLEREGLPFAFTLYPGGGLTQTPASAERLRRVCCSPCFSGMIVTQAVTQRWVEANDLAPPELVHPIWGVVAPTCAVPPRGERGGDPVSICFVAQRYDPAGLSKGYDLFVDAAEIVADAVPEARFHAVGPWSKHDHPVSDRLGRRLTWHGCLPTPRLHTLYDRMDVIVSLSRPGVNRGQYDGFPLGAAVEAGLRGVAVLASDEMNERGPFRPDVDLQVVELHADPIAERLVHLARHPGEMVQLGENARAAFSDVYGFERQLRPRIELLQTLLDRSG
jgi:glycosyltransferase involved in cell wall biosynthesis